MSRSRSHGGVVVATALGFALVQLDVSIVNVALATIGKQLGGGVVVLQWIVDAYTIAFASLLLSAGALGDRIGARRVFLIGYVVFVAASIACGVAPASGVLIVARVVQGAGAALMVPSSLALLSASAADDRARANAVSLWTLAGSIALAAGPVAGGLLVQALTWRIIFFVNVPIGIAGMWLTLRYVRETRVAPHDAGRSFDLSGQLLGIAALGTLTAAFIVAGAVGWTSPAVVVLLGSATLASAAFIAIELRSREPMLPLQFFSRASFSGATIVGFGLNLTLYGTIFLLGLFLQRTLGYAPLATGLALLPFCAALGIANLVAGRLTARLGPRTPIVAGLALAAIGALALSFVHAGVSYGALLPGLIVYPAGIGLAVPAMTSALLGSVETRSAGVASGVLNTVRQAGGAIGVAAFGTLFAGASTAGARSAFAGSAILLALTIGVAFALPRAPPTRVRDA